MYCRTVVQLLNTMEQMLEQLPNYDVIQKIAKLSQNMMNVAAVSLDKSVGKTFINICILFMWMSLVQYKVYWMVVFVQFCMLSDSWRIMPVPYLPTVMKFRNLIWVFLPIIEKLYNVFFSKFGFFWMMRTFFNCEIVLSM